MLSDQWFHSLPIQSIDRIEPVSGGDINQSFAVQSSSERYFLKVHAHTPNNFFRSEIHGLKLLSQQARTPRVIASGQLEDLDYLILEWITGSEKQDHRALGRMLADVHRASASAFGLDEDNFAGQLPQYNHRETDWADFYINWRLKPQIAIAKKRGHWTMRREKKFEKLVETIRETYRDLPVTPSLLHGDLWGGNVMFTTGGAPVLIDPSVFYGNREMDIALSRLFGGFRLDFYQAYLAEYPLEPGWEERISWYQLYYLLCHLNMFGEAYGTSVDRALEG